MKNFKVGDIIKGKVNHNTLGVLKQIYNGKAKILEIQPNGWAVVEIISTNYTGYYKKQKDVYLNYFEKEEQRQYIFCDGECELVSSQND